MKRWVITLTTGDQIDVPPPAREARGKRDPSEDDPYVGTSFREGVELFVPKWWRGQESRRMLIPWHRVLAVETFDDRRDD